MPQILRRALVLGLLALGLSGPAPVTAQSTVRAYPLSAEDRELLGDIERYMNSFRSLQARFVQVTDDGRYSEGKLFFLRPNKLRFEYEPPVPIMMIVNHGDVIYIDTELDQVTYIPVSSTPLEFLTRDRILFDDTVIITGIERKSGIVRVGVAQADDPMAGELVLTFSPRPLEIRKWSVTDTEGVTINVALFNTRKNVPLDTDLFKFIDPRVRSGARN